MNWCLWFDAHVTSRHATYDLEERKVGGFSRIQERLRLSMIVHSSFVFLVELMCAHLNLAFDGSEHASCRKVYRCVMSCPCLFSTRPGVFFRPFHNFCTASYLVNVVSRCTTVWPVAYRIKINISIKLLYNHSLEVNASHI